MKKAYSKPQILFESFELSQAIAGSCEFISNATRTQCGVYIPEYMETLFTSDTVLGGACTMTPAPGVYDDVCYDVPHDNKNVFTS